MRLPMFGAPMFLVSSPELVLAQCQAGIVGVLPVLNLRPSSNFDLCLTRLSACLKKWDQEHPESPSAPLAVNLMTHQSNIRLEEDLAIIRAHRIPVVITSLNAPDRIVSRVKDYGGVVFHDVSALRFARRALAAGVDGLVLVCAGAGGHTGRLNPLAFVAEVRSFFNGPLAVSGCVNHGSQLLAIKAMGADFAYAGTHFIATTEACAADAYKMMIIESGADDIVTSNAVTGLNGNYLVKSFQRLGIEVGELEQRKSSTFNLDAGEGKEIKAWRDVWSAGQGVGLSSSIRPAARIIEQLHQEYLAAVRRMKEHCARVC